MVKRFVFQYVSTLESGSTSFSAHALNTCAILCFTTHVWLTVSRWSESFLTHEKQPAEVNTPYMLVTVYPHSVFSFLSRMQRKAAGVMRVVQAIQLNSAVSIYFIWYIKARKDRQGLNWWNVRGQKVWVRNGRVMKQIRTKVWGAEQWMKEKRNYSYLTGQKPRIVPSCISSLGGQKQMHFIVHFSNISTPVHTLFRWPVSSYLFKFQGYDSCIYLLV